MKNITIGIISYNTKDLLVDCLESIAGQSSSALEQTVIVDNNSSDGTQEFIKRKYPQTKLIESKDNLGFAKAANKIINLAKTPYVFVLNADTVLHKQSVKQLSVFMDKNPKAGAVGPLLLNTDGSIQASGRRFPSFLDASIHAFLGVIAPNNRFSRRYKMLDWDRNSLKEVDWVSGAAICIRKEAAEQISGFDEQYFMYVEDMDLCYRLWQNNWKVFLLPEAKVTHYIGQSSKQVNAAMVKEFEKSIYRFYIKQSAGKPRRLLAPLIKAGLSLRTSLLIARSNFGRSPKP